jgi:hypothetical protein
VRHPFKSVEIYDNYHEGTAAVSPDRQSVFQGSDEGIIELWYPNRSFGRDKSSFDLPRGLSKVKLDVDLETRDITIQTEARYTAGSTKSRVDPGTVIDPLEIRSRRRYKHRRTDQEDITSSDPPGASSRRKHKTRGSEQRDTSDQPHHVAPPAELVPNGITASLILEATVSSWSSLPHLGALEHTYPKFGKKQPDDYGEKIPNMAISSKNVLAVASTDVIQLWNSSIGREVLSKFCILPDATDSGLAFSPDRTLLGAVNLIPKDVGSLVRTISI